MKAGSQFPMNPTTGQPIGSGTQPYGTGTTFYNMTDFQLPWSQQQTQTPAAPAPITPSAPTPAAPAATPAAKPVMSFADWQAKNHMRYKVPLVQQRHSSMRQLADRKQNWQQNQQNQYTMEMIKQLGGLPSGQG